MNVNVDIVKQIIKDNWNSPNGIKVVFRKKDDSLREMIVKLNEEMLSPKEEISESVIARRETNKANGNMVVTEFLPETKSYQIRTIPLKNVVSWEIL